MMTCIKRFGRDKRGVSAIEFALISPAIVFTFLGISELANYILAARKVANVASTAADLATQDTSIDDTEMADIMGALDAIIRPFDPGSAWVRITSVVADDDGDTTVAWCDARNTTAYAVDTPIEVPDDLVPDNQGIIMAEVGFNYESIFGVYTDAEVTDTFFLKPRRSTSVLRE
jgi:Flp pilus assembly protein TadG